MIVKARNYQSLLISLPELAIPNHYKIDWRQVLMTIHSRAQSKVRLSPKQLLRPALTGSMVSKRNMTGKKTPTHSPTASTVSPRSPSFASPKLQQPPATVHSLYMSKEPQYRVPTILNNPVEYFRNLWELYEATFAISMLETVILV